jgi:hypothetical protein
LRRSSVLLAALLVASSCIVSSPARAQGSSEKPKDSVEGTKAVTSRRIAVEYFKGSGDVKAVRQAVVSALEAEVTLDVASVRLLDKHKRINDGSPEGYSELAERLDLLAVLRGKVGKGEEGYMLVLTVINGRDGKALGTLAFQAKSLPELRKKLNLELFDALDPLLLRAAGIAPLPEPTPEPEPVPAPEPEPPPPPPPAKKPQPEPQKKPEAKPPATGAARGGCPWLEAELHGGVAQRSFNFVEEERGALRGYRLKYAPYASGRATYRPWAHGTCRLPAGFGVRLGYEQIFGIQSTLAEQSLDAFAFAFQSELEFRFPIDVVTLTPHTGFGYRHFQLDGNYLPDPRYKMLVLGLDGGLRAGIFLFELGGAAHFVLDAGSLQSSSWFPNATGFGWQGEGRIGVAPLPWLDVFGLAEYESYTFDLHPTEAGARGVAGGSYDRYLRFGLGARFNVPTRLAGQ